MSSQFLRFYITNLKVLSIEMNRNQQLLELLNNNTKALTIEVQEKLKQFFTELIKKQRLHDDTAEYNSRIKIIYLLMRHIQKNEAEKRSLTRKACDILDKYLATLNERVNSETAYHPNAEDPHDDELLKTLTSIKLEMNQPVQGNAGIIDLIKKMENERAKESESNVMILNDVNKNIEVFSLVQNFNNLVFDGTTKDVTNNIPDLIYRMDNLQVFTDKISDICMDMRRRYRFEGPKDQDSLTNSEEDGNSDTEEYAELCHCRTLDNGEMVACDNIRCKIRWYHFECVGLYKIPEGLWYCPSCIIFENMTK